MSATSPLRVRPDSSRFAARSPGSRGAGLVLQNNGGNDLPISADGAFAFANRLIDGATYAVVVRTQPSGQNCIVRNSTGTIRGGDASNVEVACTSNGFTIGGAVTGLAGSGLVLRLNGGNDLSIVGNGAFAFETALQNGARYDVVVRTQPGNPSQECTIAQRLRHRRRQRHQHRDQLRHPPASRSVAR